VYYGFMTSRYTSVIMKETKWFVARCLELGVVSQGKTVEKAQENLQEAVELYLEGENTPRQTATKTPLVGVFDVENV